MSGKYNKQQKVKQRSVDFTGIEENQIMSGIFQPTHLSRDMCESQEPPMCYQQKNNLQ
jgi:hypothetical protein